ncbi:MAG: aspartate aminotransferase family protein [Deltaproteobacteria bacterium]|nr:aspartate aminotransferase family protein [Deltaproteobacteria bacterium]MBW2142500.1 aspartate aminotransferase family protein [Deltaproteobacteria bacterium]MBW2324265.1 aspartate aminotransferase family protein [Deltaproteobacteria bacterium]
MKKKESERVKRDILNRFAKITKQAKKYDARAKKRLPGGETRNASYYKPYAAYMERGKGCQLYDCDGNKYIDFLNNYTSLIHGHAHPDIVKAAQEQLKKGTALCSPAMITYEHADLLCSRIPSVDMVRYCNSGTEATLFAIRAARAYTKKDMIIKMDGGYHGSHDLVEVNIIPGQRSKGIPEKHFEGPGIPKSTMRDVLVSPFNNLNALETLLKKYQGKVAGIILEPMIGSLGMIPPQPGYLKGVRKLCDKYKVILIFDEVITFRLSPGGFQAIADVEPDLTAMAKIIGGGFPVGAFGGKKEIMEPFDPTFPDGSRRMGHSGTFNGNNITMAAGLAALKAYNKAAVNRVNKLGDRLRSGFNEAFNTVGIKGHCTGLGSLTQVHWTDRKIISAKDSFQGMISAQDIPGLSHLDMMTRGIFSAPRGMYITSTPMTNKEIDKAVKAFTSSLETLKPYVAEVAPDLIA